MSLTAYSLASGSSGNSILVGKNSTSVLIDAGIGIKRLTAAIKYAGINPEDLSAILITHEHSDHIAGAFRFARKFGVRLISNAATLANISGAESVNTEILDVGKEMTIGDMLVRSFPVSHDAICPVGYSISSGNATICSITDTGILTSEIREEAYRADLLILESNHDTDLLQAGPYPWFLKRRILGERGHLSNEAACELLADIAKSGRRMSVWLAHLSKTNNTPKIAMAATRKLLSRLLGHSIRVSVAQRDVPSLRWRCDVTATQLNLFGANI